MPSVFILLYVQQQMEIGVFLLMLASGTQFAPVVEL